MRYSPYGSQNNCAQHKCNWTNDLASALREIGRRFERGMPTTNPAFAGLAQWSEKRPRTAFTSKLYSMRPRKTPHAATGRPLWSIIARQSNSSVIATRRRGSDGV